MGVGGQKNINLVNVVCEWPNLIFSLEAKKAIAPFPFRIYKRVRIEKQNQNKIELVKWIILQHHVQRVYTAIMNVFHQEPRSLIMKFRHGKIHLPVPRFTKLLEAPGLPFCPGAKN